jgi:peptidoglycan hydrolase CwlO-like protein
LFIISFKKKVQNDFSRVTADNKRLNDKITSLEKEITTLKKKIMR